MTTRGILSRVALIISKIVVIFLTFLGYVIAIRPLIKDSYVLGATDFGLLVFIFTAFPLLFVYLRERERKRRKNDSI